MYSLQIVCTQPRICAVKLDFKLIYNILHNHARTMYTLPTYIYIYIHIHHTSIHICHYIHFLLFFYYINIYFIVFIFTVLLLTFFYNVNFN